MQGILGKITIRFATLKFAEMIPQPFLICYAQRNTIKLVSHTNGEMGEIVPIDI